MDDIGDFYMVFPDPQGDLGCDVVACMGYELTTDLDFDSDGSGSVTAADDFFANFPWADSGAAAFTTTISGVFDGEGWVPIGYGIGGYGGVLDGGGHVIGNLYINAKAQYMGLFGSLKAGAVVRNLGLLEADLDNTKADAVWTGGLVGQNIGDIIAVRFDGSVNSVNDSGVTGAGGVAGENVGRIIASYATGDIATTDGPIGGLAGQNDTQVIASYSTASVTATPATPANSHVGGLIGLADPGATKNPTVTNSYFDTGASGQTSSDGGDGKTTRELQSPTGYTGIYANWDDIDLDGDSATVDENDFWRFGLPGQYPALWWEAAEVEAGATDYDSDNDGLIEVGSLAREGGSLEDQVAHEGRILAQLDAMRWDLDGDGAPDTGEGVVPHGMGCPDTGCLGYELAANLNFDTNRNGNPDEFDAFFNGGDGWEPIDGYNAVFEGNRYQISNAPVFRSIQNVGLFGALNANAVVTNVGLVNFIGYGAEISEDGDFGGSVGALAGANRGFISGSYAYGGDVQAFRAGGLVGLNTGTIQTSYAAGIGVTGGFAGGLVGENSTTGSIAATYSESTLATEDGVAGGLVGKNDGSIAASYVVILPIETTSGAVGGFIGINAGTVTASVFDRQTYGTHVAVGSGSQDGVKSALSNELQSITGYTDDFFAAWDPPADWNLDLDGTPDAPWFFDW